MSNKQLYQSTFSQLHTSVQVNWEDYQPVKKSTQIIRIFLTVAAAAAILGAFTATAVAFNLFGLRDLAFPDSTTLHVPIVDEDTGDISYEDRVVSMVPMQGYKDTPESQACVEWNEYYQQYVDTHFIDNSIYDEGGRYSAYPVYSDEMAARLEEIASKYGLELHQNMTDVPDREAWLETVGPTFLGDGNTGYYGYRYDDGTCAFDGEAILFGDFGGSLIDYQFRYSRKGYLDTVALYVNGLEDFQDWEYQTACGVKVNLALGASRSLIWADLPEGFVFVNVLTGSEGDDTFSSGPIGPAELEALADRFDFNPLLSHN